MRIFVDADGCPVKEETYRVAARHGVEVVLVANHPMRFPLNAKITLEVVPGTFDAADDWIAEQVKPKDIVITGDIPLADRCVKKQALVLGHKGNEFTPDNVGDAMAARELLIHLRQTGDAKGGPAAMSPKDRSQFLSKLDQLIHKARR